MTFRAPLLAFAFPLVLALGAAGLATPRAEPSPPAVSLADELEEVMEGMEKNFEAVIAAIEKKDAPAGLELMAKIQQACISAKTLTPPKLRTVEEKDKAAFVAGYRKQVLTLLKATADLEIALIDSDFVKAGELVEQIDAMQKTGHDEYKKLPRKK